MRLRFTEISPHGNQVELFEVTGLEQAEIVSIEGESRFTFTLKRKSETQVEMSGILLVTPVINCDRCLVPFAYPINTSFHILFETGGTENWQLKEVECTSSEMDIIFLDEPIIDCDEVFRQQILLALPQKKLCSPGCKGICSRCGENLNITVCDCENTPTNSPFAVLSRLKKND
ncbi:DUF177 domain-containing protein [Desulfogranum marinum]|jgi:uncharacterized protein|uniref:YceD family protein n=1 Tax=Desulfogranum marinum TaxID=453220 RepID=UPI001963DC8A|nr:DUF177 domain-containing protein [Desulfogranum marinum]MBM9513891.1 DUF177 domain-containing protein [Desulfogranum marinum]